MSLANQPVNSTDRKLWSLSLVRKDLESDKSEVNQEYPLSEGIFFVGSDLENDIRLEEGEEGKDNATRFVLSISPKQISIRSLSNILFSHEQQQISHLTVQDDDSIQFGSYSLRFHRNRFVTDNDQNRTEHEISEKAQIIDLLSQLRQARIDFRQEVQKEQEETRLRCQDLANFQDELEQQRGEISQEKLKLIQLRKTWLLRFKKRWSTEKIRWQELQTQLNLEKTQWQQGKDQLQDRLQNQENRLSALEKDLQERLADLIQKETKIKALEKDLSERTILIQNREKNQEAVQKKLDKQLKQQKEEVAHLEQRIHNLRKKLEQYNRLSGEDNRILSGESTQQDKNQDETVLAMLSQKLPDDALYISADSHSQEKTPGSHASSHNTWTDNQLLQLHALAKALADQRIILLEQFERFAIAKEFWRAEQNRVVLEMFQLGEKLEKKELEILEQTDKYNQLLSSLQEEREQFKLKEALLHKRESQTTSGDSQTIGFPWELDRAGNVSPSRFDSSEEILMDAGKPGEFEKIKIPKLWLEGWQKERQAQQEQYAIVKDRFISIQNQWTNEIQQLQSKLDETEFLNQSLLREKLTWETVTLELAHGKVEEDYLQKRVERIEKQLNRTALGREEELKRRQGSIEREMTSLRELSKLIFDRFQELLEREQLFFNQIIHQDQLKPLLDQLEAIASSKQSEPEKQKSDQSGIAA